MSDPADDFDSWEQERAEAQAMDEIFDDLIEQRGMSVEDLVRWTKDMHDDMAQAYLERMMKDRPVLTARARHTVKDEAYFVEVEAQRLRTQQKAKAKVEAELRPPQERPAIVSLTDFLSEPDEDVRYRVDGLWPKDGRILLTAQYKAGKTTLAGNLIRSLADGDAFLGCFETERVERVILLDNELAPNMVRMWLREQDIRKTDAVDVVSLRGKLSSFDILNPDTRAEWAEYLGPADVLILDCLRPVLDALGLSEANEAGRFLVAFDELAREAGIRELLLVHHMGHSNERSRGDSRLLDWPDALWKLVREGEEDTEESGATTPARFFSAVGRDVEQAERRLAFDPETRHLTVNGQGRRFARAADLEDAVKEWVSQNPGCSQNSIESNVDGKTGYKRTAIKSLVQRSELRREKKGNGFAHYLNDEAEAASDFSEDA
ncbi:ATP-binding protein [Terrabacter terrigena]|uniref:AAA family ATPase n=1 Tax=Terrabacter terrigena TaxID=574718 RepID=A0ABW3N1S9_9MICO